MEPVFMSVPVLFCADSRSVAINSMSAQLTMPKASSSCPRELILSGCSKKSAKDLF